MKTKNLLLFVIIFSYFIAGSLAAPGDTTIVQTLSFSDITKRRDIWEFPDTSNHYRKILMYYTLKCDPATTQDGYNCGEWDYLTYNYVYDHTGVLDSSLLSMPSFVVNGASPDTFQYTTTQPYTYYNNWQYYPVYDNVISENDFSVGNGNIQMSHTLRSSIKTAKAQYLWLASELNSAGITAGDIHKLRLDIQSLGSALSNLQIRMKHSSKTELQANSYETESFNLVYDMNTTVSATGQTTFEFSEPFTWDGASNIVVEFSFTNDNNGIDYSVMGDTTSYSSGVYTTASDGFLSFNGPDHVSVPADVFNDLDSTVTISFWAYGDPDFQPQNDYCFEGLDANGHRVLNVHLPWSNENVYWDAGNEGSFYDRINKVCTPFIYEGKWNHWAFTKDVNTGYMRIYLNGSSWSLGSGNTREMAGITTFKIGSNASGGGSYDGYINEFRVWNTALSTQTIKDWRFQDIDPSHPNYSNLVGYYKFNDAAGSSAIDNTSGQNTASLFGQPEWKELEGNELFRNLQATNERPNIIFVQGSYDMHVDSVMVVDSVPIVSNSLLVYDDSVSLPLPSDTLSVWEAGYAYTYENGIIVDSVDILADQMIILENHDYWSEPFEVVERYEIGRFITPYGINLDLGPDGFQWVYDVTDYAFLLHDWVDFSAGNQQELIDVKFLMIEGNPPREIVQMDRIWGQTASHSYQDLDDDAVLSAKTLAVNSAAETFKIKTRLTGHGHNSNTGDYPHCCEWKDNTHYVYVNGTLVDTWHVWQETECAQNPVFPQGGTWPGSREGWCPGDVVGDTDFEIASFVTGDSLTIDYDITDVPASNLGMGGGNYVVSMHLLQYSGAYHTLDAEVYDVISPNNWAYYSRVNPICSDPKIVIRNSGSDQLNSLVINYMISGGITLQYYWTGALDFMHMEEVSLPIPNSNFWSGDGTNEFIVWVTSPNLGLDQNAENDEFRTHFTLMDIYETESLVLELKTNNLPGDNSYTITDINGNIVRNENGFSANAYYYDTLDLDPGCYELSLMDTGGDGLSYWAYTAQGSGYIRIKESGGGVLKYFESEFGMEIRYAFALGTLTNVVKPVNDMHCYVFPNPANRLITVDISGMQGEAVIAVYDAYGREVYHTSLYIDNTYIENIDLSGYESGLYFVRISNNEESITKKVIKN